PSETSERGRATRGVDAVVELDVDAPSQRHRATPGARVADTDSARSCRRSVAAFERRARSHAGAASPCLGAMAFHRARRWPRPSAAPGGAAHGTARLRRCSRHSGSKGLLLRRLAMSAEPSSSPPSLDLLLDEDPETIRDRL